MLKCEVHINIWWNPDLLASYPALSHPNLKRGIIYPALPYGLWLDEHQVPCICLPYTTTALQLACVGCRIGCNAALPQSFTLIYLSPFVKHLPVLWRGDPRRTLFLTCTESCATRRSVDADLYTVQVQAQAAFLFIGMDFSLTVCGFSFFLLRPAASFP